VIVAGEHVARFVSDRLGFALCPPYYAVGIQKDGRVTGGVLINHFEGADVHATAAGSGWTPGFMKALGQYVFQQLGCSRMTMVTEQPGVAKLACRLGGQIEGTLRSHFGKGRDGTIIGVLADEWRFV
jgi:hypothetical protein